MSSQSSRGGGTGIPAAVLALLGGIFHLIGVAGGAVMLAGDDDLGRALLTFLLHVLVAGVLITGGVGLILAKPFGRTWTIGGAVLALLLYVSVLVLGSFGVFFLGLADKTIPVGYTALLCLPAVATLVLASVRPTARWVTSGWS
ncbi:hypothetical protein FPZ12_011635 [Amycolatopsis acidicola]|uniref:DUF4383 domain-containing protein n=1 Tax=Amycolatopsis acidicola TaxID=2596893 RepID=A0A5N0V793_9PSEU|nr:hypothetical protein [Amycolatopsis acidicola]KAA9162289.1 hypothetical protein FPZ12_011635 [Amycolatopsis acidicola]